MPWYKNSQFFVGCFALLNIIMYFMLGRFWIGGSSFLPLVGKFGPEKKFLLAFIVNLGVIFGAFFAAWISKEFCLRYPRKELIPEAILGGFLIGVGITLAPGTCTTAFVVGIPMFSVSSFLSIAGIFLGVFSVYTIKRQRR